MYSLPPPYFLFIKKIVFKNYFSSSLSLFYICDFKCIFGSEFSIIYLKFLAKNISQIFYGNLTCTLNVKPFSPKKFLYPKRKAWQRAISSWNFQCIPPNLGQTVRDAYTAILRLFRYKLKITFTFKRNYASHHKTESFIFWRNILTINFCQ